MIFFSFPQDIEQLHRIYHKDGLKRPIIVPQTKHLTVNVILSNLRTLKMDREEYLKIISRV